MFSLKQSKSWASALTVLGAATLALAGSARASQFISAVGCQPMFTDRVVSYAASGILNVSTDTVDVQCPTNVDHDIGKAQWDVYMFDPAATTAFCYGSVLNGNGTQHAMSAVVSSSGTGSQVIQLSATGSTWTATRSYSVECRLPANPAGQPFAVHGISLF